MKTCFGFRNIAAYLLVTIKVRHNIEYRQYLSILHLHAKLELERLESIITCKRLKPLICLGSFESRYILNLTNLGPGTNYIHTKK